MTVPHTPGPFVPIKGIEQYDDMRCGVAAVRDEGQYLVATIENGAPGDFCDTEWANACLFAAAPDHAIIAAALCTGIARWNWWSEDRGEVCVAGFCFPTELDEFRVPKITDALREALIKAGFGQ